MGTYRRSRNLEVSTKLYLASQLTGSWSGVSTRLGFPDESTVSVPMISIRLSDTTHEWAEVGSTNTKREALIFLDLFCSSDGQRLDLKDYLISILKDGYTYYETVITNRAVDSQTANGKVRVLEMRDTPVDLGVDKSQLHVSDRYRHLITLRVGLGTVES